MDLLKNILNSQRSFFQSGETLNVAFRLNKLKALKRVLFEYENRILDVLKVDLNKPKQEAFLGEFLGMVHELDTTINKLKKWSRGKRVGSPLLVFPSRAFILTEPYGQVLIISPWNYPLDLCMSPLIGAVAAGNTVIIKPSEYTPHTSSLVREILSRVFDNNYVNVQLGGIETSQALLKLKFDYIFFTGSVRVGKEVMRSASENLTPVTLELGGKCPVIVSKNYDVKKAAKSIAWGKFFNAGQSCVAPDYILLPKESLAEFTEAFKNYMEHFLVNKANDYTCIINTYHFNRIVNYLSQGKVLYGGDHDEGSLHIAPALILPESMKADVMQEEIFGPVLPVICYDNEDDALNFIHSREKPLVIYLFSDQKREQRYYARQTSSGSLCINDTLLNYVNKNLPFGGVGNSGMGKYHGKASFDTFSNKKGVHVKLRPDFPFRYPPYNDKYNKFRLFIKVLNKNI
jgi:aldehyde dehydrogenase (NAD+)